MSEEPPSRKRYRSDDSSDEELAKKPEHDASGLLCGNRLQMSIDEGMRQLSVYQSNLRRGCVASKGSILAVLDAMRAEIIGSAASDKHSLRLILPDEVLLDIFVCLDRLRLEKLQYACRRFRTIVDLRMTDVCYRTIDCVHIRPDEFGCSVTACVGDHGYGTPLLTSEVSKQGERRTIIASKLDLYKDDIADVLTNVCRNANVLLYKISKVSLSDAWLDMRETWPKLVPANANRMTVTEFVLDECIVGVPRDGSVSPDTIVMRMLYRFRRVHGVRLSIEVKLSYGPDETGRRDVFTDNFLECCAAYAIGSADLSNWDKGISDKSVVDFLLNAPSDRCKRELSFGGAKRVTARFYDALVKASMECTTAHTASLMVSNCDWDSLPQDQERDADREDEGGWRESQYRFFHGLVPFSLAGDDGGCCSDSGPFFCYRRSDEVRQKDDEGGRRR